MQKGLNLNNKLSLLFLFFCLNSFSQIDTIFTSRREKIPCHISEITEETIFYNLNGNKKKINITEVNKIVFKNGNTEKFQNKPQKFDLKSQAFRDTVQKKANVWGTKLLKCAFSKVSLNTTYINWDQTYTDLINDSILNISFKTYYSLPGIGDNEELYWKVKTNIALNYGTFTYLRTTDGMTSDVTFLDCIHKLNRSFKKK